MLSLVPKLGCLLLGIQDFFLIYFGIYILSLGYIYDVYRELKINSYWV